jgi:hypothetical protein
MQRIALRREFGVVHRLSSRLRVGIDFILATRNRNPPLATLRFVSEDSCAQKRLVANSVTAATEHTRATVRIEVLSRIELPIKPGAPIIGPTSLNSLSIKLPLAGARAFTHQIHGALRSEIRVMG